jgi:hypothetical protein
LNRHGLCLTFPTFHIEALIQISQPLSDEETSVDSTLQMSAVDHSVLEDRQLELAGIHHAAYVACLPDRQIYCDYSVCAFW